MSNPFLDQLPEYHFGDKIPSSSPVQSAMFNSNLHIPERYEMFEGTGNPKKVKMPTKEQAIMAVNEWLQKTSKTEYIWAIYQINILVGSIVAHVSKKYKDSYGEKMIEFGLDALNCAHHANDIYMKKENISEQEYELRTNYLKGAASSLKNLMSATYIFLENVKHTEGFSEDKVLYYEGQMALLTNTATAFLKSIMRSDKETYKKSLIPH